MKKILTFASHKGGVGKTTCALQFAATLAQRHQRRVLVIDFDSQGNMTRGLTREPIPAAMTATNMLLNFNAPVTDYIINVRPNIDLIPNAYEAEQDQELARLISDWQNLKHRLRPILDFYDHIVFDTPSALLHPTRSAIVVADQVMLVMSCGQYSLAGATNLISQVMDLQHQSLRSHIPVKVLINLFDERRKLDQHLLKDIERIFESDLCRTKIRHNIRLGEATLNSQTIFERDADSLGAHDFESLTGELLGSGSNGLATATTVSIESNPAVLQKFKTVIIPIRSEGY